MKHQQGMLRLKTLHRGNWVCIKKTNKKKKKKIVQRK